MGFNSVTNRAHQQTESIHDPFVSWKCCRLTLTRLNVITTFILCETFVSGGVFTMFHCSIPRARNPGNFHTRESLKGFFCVHFFLYHLFGPVNHGQNWKGWERSREKGLIISDNYQ
jgi:hypothetical protein